MIKKNINQNDILNIELLKSLNLGFTFNKSPINRYKTKENVQLSLTDLKNTIDAIQDCELKKNATQAVFGSGTTKSKLMIIGGAPGEKEDQKGKPFVGDDGSLLDKMLNAIDIKRENIYFNLCCELSTSS